MVKSNSSRSGEKSTDLKKGAWSAEEDQKLINYIKRYKIWNWSEMSKAAGLKRSGKSCRLRWVNYLRPDIKQGNFSSEEVETIRTLHETLGNRWATIAASLPGRTDNEVKNFWHTHLKKRLNKSNPSTSTSTSTSSVILIHDDDEISRKPMSESELVLFSLNPDKEITAPNLGVIEWPQPMSTDEFYSPPLVSINSENNSNNYDQQLNLIQNTNTSVATTNCTLEMLEQPQTSLTQQEQQMVGELLDPGHGSQISSNFEPYSLAGPSANELIWPHESTWTYENFCEAVSNDLLDYMDPLF